MLNYKHNAHAPLSLSMKENSIPKAKLKFKEITIIFLLSLLSRNNTSQCQNNYSVKSERRFLRLTPS